MGTIFSKLRWKFTLSYIFMATAVLMIDDMWLTFVQSQEFKNTINEVEDFKKSLLPSLSFLPKTPSKENSEELGKWLSMNFEKGYFTIDKDTVSYQAPVLYAAIKDYKKDLVSDIGHSFFAHAEKYKLPEDTDQMELISVYEIDIDSKDIERISIPYDGNDFRSGTIYIEILKMMSDAFMWWPEFFKNFIQSLSFGLIIGAFLGYFLTKKLIYRMEFLGELSNEWARGDFSRKATDLGIQDEIGQLERNFNSMAKELERLMEDKQRTSVMNERNRIAVELHDTIKQQLFSVQLHLSAANKLLDGNDIKLTNIIDFASKINKDTQQQVIDLINAYRPASITEIGLVPTVDAYLAEWNVFSGVSINKKIEGKSTLNSDKEVVIYRVLREAFINIRKHSHATVVNLSLNFGATEVSLSVIDNGIGFDLNQLNQNQRNDEKTTFGLHVMEERIHSIGGTFTLSSFLDKGTSIYISVPV